MNEWEELISTIENFDKREAWQKELILTSEYYYIRIICLYIQKLKLKEKVLHIELDNGREYRVTITEDSGYSIVDRFDLNLLEDKKNRRRRH